MKRLMNSTCPFSYEIPKITMLDHCKLIFKRSLIACDPASKNGDFACKITYKIMNNKIYILKHEVLNEKTK